MHHAFLYLSLLYLHDCDLKVLNLRFVEDVSKRQLLSFSFPELRYSPLEFKFANIGTNCLSSLMHLTYSGQEGVKETGPTA